MKLDLHTHYYPLAYFDRIERSGGDFSFGTSPTGQRIIRYRGARFFGITAPMTDVAYAELAATHPGRFLGFASIPMDDPDAALRELERAVDELRMQGVILLSN